MPDESATASREPPAVVYYDGACPLCASEIRMYRKADLEDALCFVDVSQAGAALPPWTDRGALRRRLHVRTGAGELVSGARAFLALWERLPAWRGAAKVLGLPPILLLLEGGYRGFLPLRPLLSRAFAATIGRDRAGRG